MSNRTGSPCSQQTQILKPGNYDLGSLESRAAARALLDAKSADDQQNRLRVVVRSVAGTAKFGTATCLRYKCADSREPGKSLVIEMVDLDGSHPTEMELEQLEDWISRVPIDGQTYKFGEVGNG
jgi:hypothetical protein